MATTPPISEDANTGDYASATDVEKQLAQLSADIAALTKVVASFGSGKLDEASQQAKMFAEDLSQRSSAAASDIKDRLAAAESDLEGRIRRNPLASVGIAAGVGFFLALLSRR